MSKLSSLNNNYNPDKDRKSALMAILTKGSERSDDDVHYLDNYLKKYFSAGVGEIQAKVDAGQWKKLLFAIKYERINQGFLQRDKPPAEIDFYFLLSGKIELLGRSATDKKELPLETFDQGKSIVLKDLGLYIIESGLSVFSPGESELLVIDKRSFSDFSKEENAVLKQQRQKALEKSFSRFKKAENKDELLRFFKPKDYAVGYVLTTTTSGSTDLFVVTKGKVLLFLPNNFERLKEYPRSFLIISILAEGSTFNENYVLFGKDATFGSMAIEDGSEILSIDKVSLSSVTDENSLDCLRASYQAKERLFKMFIEKFQSLSLEDIAKQQDDLCHHFHLVMKDLEALIAKSTSGGKIVTTSSLEDKDKLLEKFNKTFSKPIDPSNCGANMPGTNRLAPAKVNGFTREQVLAMNSLKKYAATSNGSQQSNPEKKENDVNSIKNRLLNEELKNVEGGLSKISIADKKNLNKIEPEERKACEKGINLSKFQQSNDDLLKKLNIGGDPSLSSKPKEKEEPPSNIVKIMKKMPSTDKNGIEVDNTRLNLLLMEQKK